MLGDNETNDSPVSCQTQGQGPSGAPARLPYQPPRLRHLGSVRKLTLASTGASPDFSGGRHKS